MNSVQYIGMDVDKEKIILARLGAGNAKEVQEHAIANTPNAVKVLHRSAGGGRGARQL